MTAPTIEVLCNLCNSVFSTYEGLSLSESQKTTWEKALNKLLNMLDMRADFEEEKLTYRINSGESVFVTRSFSKKYLKRLFAITPYYCSEHDVHCMEDIINDNPEYAGSLGSVFNCIGYVIVNEDERWRLRWHARDALAFVGIDEE